MIPFVVFDASAALALVLTEEEGKDAAELLSSILTQNGQLHVPDLFWYEVCNGLISAERQKRIKANITRTTIAELRRMPFVSHASDDDSHISATLELARKHDLTYYEAAYLELALRCQARLKTYDSHLVSLKPAYPDVIL